MKTKLLKKIVTVTKYALFGTILQCLLLTGLMAREGKAQTSLEDVYVSIQEEELSVEEVFSRIERSTEFRFAYRKSIINNNIRISYTDGRRASVAGLLRKVSESTDLKFKRINNVIHVNKATGDVPVSEDLTGDWLQAVTVTGKVISGEDSEGLPGVNVIIKGTHQGTVTDLDGSFKIDVPSGESILVFSSVGFITEEVLIGSQSVINLTLMPDVTSLGEIVIVGYGEQSRATITNSITKIGEEEFVQAPGQNPLLQLQGKVAGLSLQASNGQPGTNPQVFIRGGTTTSPESDSPLFIVDGIISQGMRNVSDMNPEDIESVQVLKDAASTAIYGARAANGIVIIKTKTGRKGKPKINFAYTSGVEQQAKRLPLLNARDYVYLSRSNTMKFNQNNPDYFLTGGRYGMSTGNPRNSRNTLEFLDVYLADYGQDYVAHLLENEGWETMEDPVTGRQLIFQDNDFQDATYQTGYKHEFDFNISGGTDVATYYLGLGYMDQDGIVRGTYYKNYSGIFSGTFKLSDSWSIDTKVDYQVRDVNAPNNYDWVLSRGILTPPTYRLYYEDGTPAPGEGAASFRSRLHEMYYKTNYNDAKIYRSTLKLGANWDILPGLRFTPAAYYFTTEGIENYFEAYNETQRTRPASARHNFDKHVQLDALLTYDKQLATKHNLNAVLGASYNHDYSYRMSGSGREALTDHIPTLNATSEETQRVSTTKSYDALLSYFGRATYNFDYRYLLSASVRTDGSSRFSENHKWGFFPGVSAGWNIHNERFFAPVNTTVSHLKVRSSWGKTGNNSLSIYDSQGQYATGYSYMGNIGILNTTLINSNLVWESTTSFDVGMDLGIINDRVSILVDYYNKLTEDRLFDKPLWASTGFGSIRSNFGSIRNRGIEVELQAKPIEAKNFSWDLAMTFSYNKGIVVKLPENEEDKNRVGGNFIYDPQTGDYVKVGGIAEGERFGGRWAFNFIGIYQTDEEAAEAPYDVNAAGRTKVAGDAIFEDRDGDGRLDAKDMIFMGYIRPDKMGGIVNTFQYKNLSLRFVMDWAVGHVIDNGFKGNMMGSSRNNNNALRDALTNSWQEPGDDAKYPRYAVQSDYDYNLRNHMRWDNQIGNTGGGSNNSLYYSKGDYLAFREISFSYKLRNETLKKASLEGVEIFGGVFNLGYLTAYEGMMPEIFDGKDYGVYPRPRQFNIGIRTSF